MHGRLELHDVKDTEALCGKVVARSGLRLTPDQHERLVTYLIETAWELSLRYRPGTGSTANFASWCTVILRKRVVDWIRTEQGRYPRPEVVSLDAERILTHGDGHRFMGSADTDRARDTTPDRSPDLMRAIRGRSSSAARGEAERDPSSADRAA